MCDNNRNDKNDRIDLKSIGRRLKEVREELGMTLEKMQTVTSFSKSQISASENGLKKPSTIYLYILFHKLNVNIHYIFSGKGTRFLEYEQEFPGMGMGFGQDYEEMMSLMMTVPYVRHSMISSFLEFRMKNRKTIAQMIDEQVKDAGRAELAELDEQELEDCLIKE